MRKSSCPTRRRQYRYRYVVGTRRTMCSTAIRCSARKQFTRAGDRRETRGTTINAVFRENHTRGKLTRVE